MRFAVLGVLSWLNMSAYAGEVFPEDLGLVEFLPIADVVADGVTAVPLHFLALDGDGQGIEGIEAKLTATAGVVQEWNDEGNGLYRLMWLPPKLETMGSAQIKLKGKTSDKQTIKRAATVRMRPWPPGAIMLGINPAQLSAGQVDTATLSIALADTLTPTTPEDLALRVSTGTVADMTHMGSNRFTGRYEAASQNHPSLGIVTLADARRTSRSYGAFAIPIAANRKETIRAPAGTDVMLKVGDREYGPVKASKRGKVEVEILAQPGISEAVVSVMKDGDWTQKTMALSWPAPKRLQWVPTPNGLPGHGGVTVPVRIAVFDLTGQPDANASLRLTASTGSLSSAEYEGDGIYVAQYTPANVTEVEAVTLEAVIENEDAQKDSIGFDLVPGRAESVTIKAQPESLAGAKDVTLCAEVRGSQETDLSRLPITWGLTGGAQQGEATPSDGCQQVKVKTYGAGLRASASTGTHATGNPLHRVVLVDEGGVPADGVSSTMLTVMSLDVFGYPVANVPVRLMVEGGDGALPTDTTTNAQGMAQVFYTAGRRAGLIRIRANAGQSSAVVGFLQGPALLKAVQLPRSGSLEEAELSAAWAKTIGRIHLAP